MAKSIRIGTTLMMAVALLMAFSSGVLAHRMLIEQDGDILVVRYDDRTVSSRATVQLYNEDDDVVWEGDVNSDGRLQLAGKQFARAVAEDGLGHRAVYIPDQVQTELPRPLAAAVGVSFFLLVASFGRYLSITNVQKENKEKEK